MFFKIIILATLISFQSLGQGANNLVVNSINKDELSSIINNRNGKALLINVWATWCIPCRKEFPDLVEVAKKYSSEIDLIAISVDYPKEIEKKVLPFLKNQKVTFPVFISDFKNDTELIEMLNLDWNGALPGSFIYNSKSEQIKFFEGKQSFESFSSIINIL